MAFALCILILLGGWILSRNVRTSSFKLHIRKKESKMYEFVFSEKYAWQININFQNLDPQGSAFRKRVRTLEKEEEKKTNFLFEV
jgi:hypothetical protein